MTLRKNFDEIDKYFSGEMSPEEKVAFENRLVEDTELKSDVAEYQEINSAIKHRDTFKFVSGAMEDLEKRQQGPVRRLISNPAIRAAAIIVVLLGIMATILWQINLFEKEPRALAECFAPQQIDYTFRGDNTEIDQILTRGAKLFNTERYEEASGQFNKVVDLDPGHIQAKYYLGISYLYSAEYSKALPLLQEIANSGDMNYSAGAKWHLAWCYLQSDQKEKALEPLEELKGDGYYGEKVEEAMILLKE